MEKKLLLSIIFTYSLVMICHAQPMSVMRKQHEGRFGLGASFGSGNTQLIAPLWITNKFVIVPSLHMNYLQKREFDLMLGMSTRHYMRNDDLSTYFGLRLGSMILFPYGVQEVDKSIRTDLFAGVAIGMEYFLARQFSVGIEVQGDFMKSDERSQRFNNAGGFGFKLAPVILATFYF